MQFKLKPFYLALRANSGPQVSRLAWKRTVEFVGRYFWGNTSGQ